MGIGFIELNDPDYLQRTRAIKLTVGIFDNCPFWAEQNNNQGK
jgi:hypothetical protein